MKTLINFSKLSISLTALIILVTGITAFAPLPDDQLAFSTSSGSTIKVSGTSTMHDWNMQAAGFNCDGNVIIKGNQLQDVSVLSFSLPVANLKSGESLMDSRAYKALNSAKFKTITFKLTDAVVAPQQKTLKATGNLTIAGVTNPVTIHASYTINSDETITFKGSKSIKMTDFKIAPPSFMLGALKTGNDLTIDINLKVKLNKQSI